MPMRRSSPLRGLLAGLLALVVVTTASVAVVSGEPAGSVPPAPAPAPAVAAAPSPGTTGDTVVTPADGEPAAADDARTVVVAGDGDNRGFRGPGGGDFGSRGGRLDGGRR